MYFELLFTIVWQDLRNVTDHFLTYHSSVRIIDGIAGIALIISAMAIVMLVRRWSIPGLIE